MKRITLLLMALGLAALSVTPAATGDTEGDIEAKIYSDFEKEFNARW